MLAANRPSVASAFRRKDPDPQIDIVPPSRDTVSKEICALSGMAANTWCPRRQLEWVSADGGLLPCSWHHLSEDGLIVVWPPEYRQWARQNGLLETARVATTGTLPVRAARAEPARPSLTIVNPPAGATYLIDPTLRREFQTLAFRAAGDRATRIVWSVNGRETGTSSADTAFMWPLVTGQHRITASDDRGRTAETSIVVR
jgi:membrane carboxypeptidase/penicillin-binding protein PbpC